MQDNARPCGWSVSAVPARGRHWCYGLARPFPRPESNWAHLGHHVSLHPPTQRGVAPQTFQDALVQVWEEIPQETIRHLIGSMPRRCREVIQARGGHTLSLILTCFKDITSKLDQPVVWFPTLILSVTPNPDLHGLINLISIDHFCVILLSAHSTM